MLRTTYPGRPVSPVCSDMAQEHACAMQWVTTCANSTHSTLRNSEPKNTFSKTRHPWWPFHRADVACGMRRRVAGVVDEDDGWAWHSKPTQQEFQDVIKVEFDADDEDGTADAAPAPVAALPAETLHAGATLKRSKKKAGNAPKASKIKEAKSTGNGSDAGGADGGDASEAPDTAEAPGNDGGELGEFGNFNLTLTAWPADLPEKDAAKFEKLWVKERAKAAKKFVKDAKKSKMVPEDCGELRQKTEALLMATRTVLDEKAAAAAAKAAKKKK